MNDLQIIFTDIEISAARTLLNKISTSLESNVKKMEFQYYEKENFFDAKIFEWQPFSQFISCNFSNIIWNGIKGNNLSIKNSFFSNCSFENSNLKYTSFRETNLQILAKATSFDYSDYTKADISNSAFSGCSFTGCLFIESRFNSCDFCEVEFTDAIFIGVHFEAIDFSKTSMENAEFKDCTFINCIMPYFEVVRISYGLNEILQNNSILFKPVCGNYIAESPKYIQEIHELLPVFYDNNDFISLANIYIYEGNNNAAYHSIINGIKYACDMKDFKLINNLCKLAAINNFFTPKQLKWFYKMFKNNVNISDLTAVERHRYLNELAEVQKILLDFATAPNIMYITLETNYCYKDTEKLTSTIQKVYETIDMIDSTLGNSMVIRHNSPPTIIISLSGGLDVLILAFGAIIYVLNKSLTYIDKIQQLVKNQNDLKLQKLDIKIKELEIAQKTESKQETSSILLPEDFKNVSYIMKAEPSCPSVLLSFDMKTGIPNS